MSTPGNVYYVESIAAFHDMKPVQPPTTAAPPATLAQADLPARVRRILDTYLASLSSDVRARLNDTLVELEQQVYRDAHGNGLQEHQLASLDSLRRRGDLALQFLSYLEAQLARTRLPQTSGPAGAHRIEYSSLSLVDHEAMDQEVLLEQLVHRHETHSRPGLFLLGQRFGVLAGAPAFDVSRIPAGPQSLCDALRDTLQALQVDPQFRLPLCRAFEQRGMAEYDAWLDVLNDLLEKEGVLPGLVYLPPLARTQKAGRPQTGAPADAGWAGQKVAAQSIPADLAAMTFADLQRLLSNHHAHAAATDATAPGTLSSSDALAALRAVQMQARSVQEASDAAPRNVRDLRENLLAHARAQHGAHASLDRHDADSLELLELLYDQVQRDVRDDNPVAEMLVKLQGPMAQVALRDEGFFVRPEHPARELLNAVAEAGTTWLAEEDGDPHLVQRLRQTVDQVVASYNGDAAVFEQATRDVRSHVEAATRKAEMAERRHIEAARGKERLELAKQRAAGAIDSMLQAHQPPKFVQTLLKQAWADALTLISLRNDQDSPEWADALRLTERIGILTSPAAEPTAGDEELAATVQSALIRVGYHEDEAGAIARRLSGNDDSVSRTKLTARLKARVRLGEQAETPKEPLPPRTPREQELHEQLRSLPFGTWFEFVRDPQGDAARHRLSWYSLATDRALFVNQRGQPVGEQTLDSVARLMAQGRARVLAGHTGRLIDRAWRTALSALGDTHDGDAP